MSTELPHEHGVNQMDMSKVKVINIGTSRSPVNFMDGLALMFIGLKLTGHLDTWTWIEVLAPLWAPLMFVWFVRLVVSTFFTPVEEE